MKRLTKELRRTPEAEWCDQPAASNVLCLDLSLTASGVVVLRLWPSTGPDDPGFQLLHEQVSGSTLADAKSEHEQLARMMGIASAVARVGADYGVARVAMEGGAFNQRGRIFHLGGLHFVVQAKIRTDLQLQAETVTATRARKRSLTCAPTRKQVPDLKGWVGDALRARFGLDLANEHTRDAVVVGLATHYAGRRPLFRADPLPESLTYVATPYKPRRRKRKT